MMSLVIFVSVLVVFVCAWLVNYITKFIVQKRGQEFAVYLTLGMEKKDVSRLFLREGLLMGLASLCAGMLAGEFVYQIFKAIIMNIFESPFAPSLEFSIPALALTLAFFLLIYPVALSRNNRWLKKSDILQLMSFQKQNEERGIQSKRMAVFVLMLSIIGMAAAVVCLVILSRATGDTEPAILGLLAFMCLCMYGIYISLSTCLSLMKGGKNRYKGTNLFLLRQFTSKVNSTGKLMGTISLLLMFSLLSLWGGFLFNSVYRASMDIETPFDITMYTEDPGEGFASEYEYINENYTITNSYEYSIYNTGQRKLCDIMYAETDGWLDSDDPAMRLSDYNALRQERGWDPIVLGQNEYAVHADQKNFEYMYRKFLQDDGTVRTGGKDFALDAVYGGGFAQLGLNGWLYVLVLPDKSAESLPVDQNNLIVITEGGAPASLAAELRSISNGKPALTEMSAMTYRECDKMISVRKDTIANSLSGTTVFGFAAFYLGLCLLLICATVLAVQQLSDSAKFKYRFDVIRKMGVSAGEVSRLVFKQIAAYFLFPVVLPVALCVCMVFIAANGALRYSLISGADSYLVFFIGLAVLMTVYACYFVTTYAGYKRNIE
jgi:hypothetical protein